MIARILVVAVCLTACIPALRSASTTDAVALAQPLDRFPSTIAGSWHAQPTAPLEPAVVARLGADDVLNRNYATGDRHAVSLFIGYYGSQRTGSRAHYPMSCLPGQGWQPTETGEVDVQPIVDGKTRPLTVNRYVIRKGLTEQMMFFWYQGHGRTITNEYWGKLYLVVDALTLKRTDTAMVRVTSEVSSNEPGGRAAAEARARQFVEALFPVVDGYLPR